MCKEEIVKNCFKEYAEQYMEKVYYFCLRRTGGSDEAEDLTSEISLAVFEQLHKGNIPANFSGWVWQIARNQYSKWADRKRIKSEYMSPADIEDLDVSDPDNSEYEFAKSEELSLLRRELAFISSEYRNVIVPYYIDDLSLRHIASSLHITEEAAKKRLFRARKILKEGMEMARDFGIRSYKPDEINFIMSGAGGKGGEPWTLLGSILHKNILLEAYDNPSTIEQLSVALGVAAPYMEEAAERLFHETLLEKKNGKYVTSFYIVSKEAQQELNEAIRPAAAEFTCLLIDYLEELRKYAQKSGKTWYNGDIPLEDAKWTLLIKYTDKAGLAAQPMPHGDYTDRPHGGKWDLLGFEDYHGDKSFFVGQHGCFADIDFGQYKIRYKDIYDKTPEQLSELLGNTLGLLLSGKQEQCQKEPLDKLIQGGYLVENGGVYTPAFVVFHRDFTGDTTASEKFDALTDVRVKYREMARKLIMSRIPKNLDEHQITFAVDTAMNNWRGAVLEEAMRIGYISYDETPNRRMIGTYMVI